MNDPILGLFNYFFRNRWSIRSFYTFNGLIDLADFLLPIFTCLRNCFNSFQQGGILFGYRLKWNFLKRNILCLAFNHLTSTTNFFCHRTFYRFSCRAEGLSNLFAIDHFINTPNFLATSFAFLKEDFFISVTIGIRYILCFIWKDYRFCLRHCPFGHLVGWILWLNRSFANMTFFLCPFSFHYSCIGWSLWLNRSFSHVTFFLRPFSFHYSCIGWSLWLNKSFSHVTFFLRPLCCYNWRRAWLRGWLRIFFCTDGNNLRNRFFSELAFNYSANFLSIYYTHFRQYSPLSILASSQHPSLPFG